MYQVIFSLLIVSSLGLYIEPVASAEYTHNYTYYLDQAELALKRHEYLKAIDFLKQAHRVSPSAQYPLAKIKVIQEIIRNQREGYNEAQAQKILRLYQKYAQLGKEAFEQGDYKKASYYFHYASLTVPDEENSAQYINLIKRLDEGRVFEESQAVEEKHGPGPPAKPYSRDIGDQDSRVTQQTLVDRRKAQTTSKPATIQKSQPATPTSSQKLPTKILPLDDLLWSSQPKTQLQIELGSDLILESRDIDRFLVITPGVVNVERLDRDHLKVTPIHVGSTIMHVWDGRGRWTFQVQIIFPVQALEENKPEVPAEERYADPFRFNYSVDGGAFYRGSDFPSSERQNLNLQQILGVVGETPYGVMDGSVGFHKFEESTEAASYTIGLTGAKGMGLSDVNVRGFDAVKYFSPLTFPGQYFRGILLEGKAADEKIGAVYVHGQDRFTYSFLTPGVVEDRRSYVEGTRLTLYPNEENQYSFNYARGYGEAREPYLKSQVYSLEGQHRFDPVLLRGEVATNTDNLAETLSSKFGSDDRFFYAHFRDIDRDFTTVTGLPSNQGEIGAAVGMDLEYDLWRTNTNLDFYRDRFLPNPDDPDAINYDLSSSVNMSLADTVDLLSSVYYLDTPGELSPRRNFRWMNTLSKRYVVLGGRDLRTYVGGSYHRNRVSGTPISEYDRYAATAGLQLQLIRHLSYFANYEYSWVDELLSDEVSHPSVINTGLNYARELTQRTSMTASFYYRDEQNSEGTNSFLAGEDSITGGLGFSYRPTDNAELFVDSRVRNVWRENPENPAYNEIDVRWGLRSAWDLPFAWSPAGVVYGTVYKDLNGDGKRDPEEPGIPDVFIRVGKKEALTDRLGEYKTKVRAKEVLVSADSSSVPNGYVLSTPAIHEIKIPSNQSVDFGFTVQSGIYGIFYHDRNQNNQPDEGDEFVSKARITMDNTVTETSDYDGTYFFKNISKGRHTLRIDVNSLPFEYLPLIKLVNQIQVAEGSMYVFHVPLKKKNP